MGLFNAAWGFGSGKKTKCSSSSHRKYGNQCVTQESCVNGVPRVHSWDLKPGALRTTVPLPDCSPPSEDHLVRRLRTSNMDVNSLMVILQELETLKWKFPGIIYHGRSVEIKAITDGTFFHSFGSMMETLAKVSSPFYHHELLLPLGLNGTVAGAVEDVFGITNASSFLIIHLIGNGLEAQVVQEAPPKESNSYTFAGAVHPSWMIPTLKAASQKPYHIFHWNCHKFAVHFFTEMRRACTASGVSRCPPEDINAAFPMIISPWWCWYGQVLGVMASAVGSACLMVWVIGKLRHRGAKHVSGLENECISA